MGDLLQILKQGSISLNFLT